MNGDLMKLADKLDQLVEFPTNVTKLGILLRECSAARDLHRGRQVHSYLTRGGYGRYTFLGNLLVQMYANCGCLEDASLAFEAIQERNVFSWNIMLGAYAQNGRLEEAENVFHKMPQHDVVSWNAMVAAYAQNGYLQRAESLFQQMPLSDAISWNAMILAYGQNGQLQEAKSKFDEIPERNAFSWNVMISVYAQNRHLQDARMLFEKMPAWSVVSWNAVITACGHSGDLDAAKSMLDEMPQRDRTSWNVTLAAYAQNGHLSEARSTFEMMPQRDVVSWNNMVAAYAQNGHSREARAMLEKMPEWSVLSSTAMLQAYAQTGHLQEARSLFQGIAKRDVVSWNAMIMAYAQNGYLQGAKSTFDEMEKRNVVSWNTMTRSFMELGYPEAAQGVFDKMPRWDDVTWNSMISGYGQNGQLQEASSMFDKMPEWDIVSWTAIMTAYAQNGHIQDAREIFNRMPERDVAAWNAMIAGYAQNGHMRESIQVFRLMDEDGEHPDKITFTSLLDACSSLEDGKLIHSSIVDERLELSVAASLVNMYGKCGSLEDARAVFDRTLHWNAASWSPMITSYAQNGQAQEALKLFRLMSLEGLRPDKVGFISTLEACACLGAVSKGRSIHATILESGFQIDGTLGTALVNMYGKCGSLGDAWRVFDQTEQQRDVISWNAMITTYAQNGHGNQVLELFRTMVLEGVQPSSITFLTVIFACSHAGMTVNGADLFSSILDDYDLVPTRDHYMCMIDLLARAGQLKEVEDLITSMPIEPDAVAWKTLLGACRIHGDSNRGASAAERVLGLDPVAASPYVLLSNIYVHQAEAESLTSNRTRDQQDQNKLFTF